MPSSITCSTKTLNFAIAPFLFILVGVLCEFAMVPGLYILLSPQEEKVYYSSWGHRCIYTFSTTFINHQKYLNLCLTSYNYAKVIEELEKTPTRNSAVFWCL